MPKKSSSKDQHFIAALLTNNHVGIQAIYDQFFPRIKNMVIKNSGKEEDAWDVFQDALIVIYKKAQQPDFELTSAFYSFLYGVAYRIWLKKISSSKYRQVTFEQVGAFSSEEDFELLLFQQEQEKLYRDKFVLLRPKCQSILQLFVEKVKMSVIAQKLGYASENAAKKAKHVCKKQLVALIKADARFQELKNV